MVHSYSSNKQTVVWWISYHNIDLMLMRGPAMWAAAIILLSLIPGGFGFHDEGYQYKHDFVDSLFLIPKYRMAFCIIPKCGSTIQSKLLGTLSRYGKTKCSVDTWRWSSPECLGMNIKNVVNDIYKNSSWRKMIFYRNPLIRFQSAFTSKCVPGHDPLRNSVKHCVRAFGAWNITQEHALQQLKKKKKMQDIHFIPQSWYCGNLSKYIDYYDTTFDLDTVRYGEVHDAFINAGLNESSTPKVFSLLREYFPEVKNNKKDPHITEAAQNYHHLYCNKEYLKLLQDYYIEDFKNFNFALPIKQ